MTQTCFTRPGYIWDHRLVFVANVTMLYGDLPVLDRAAAAVADGYRRIESWWPFSTSVPEEDEVRRFVDSVHEAGAQLVALNFTLGDSRGILSHRHRAAEFDDHCAVLAGIVGLLDVRLCNAPYGVVEGSVLDTALANLEMASARLRPLGAMPMLEPMSGIPGYPVTTAAQAADVIERVDGDVGLLADLYHLAANGEDIDAVLRRHVEKIVHVQVADFPGRHEPGTGELEIDRYLRLLRELGYRGDVALEYVPSRRSR
jgi:hydroxypyruvate isomerase